MNGLMRRLTCRQCDKPLDQPPLVDLGLHYVSDFPKPEDWPPPETRRVPLELVSCVHCGLAQLTYTTPRDWHYRGDYWYRSGINESMRSALEDVVVSVLKIKPMRYSDVWIDIGANDGTLLASVYDAAPGMMRVAVEPVPQFSDELSGPADMVIPDYWPCRYDGPKAQVITSIAMFYDLDDPHAFVEAIKDALAEDGVWICQFTDLPAMLKSGDVGNICHEHLTYWSIFPLEELLHEHGLGLIDVTRNAVNGGSVRYFIGHRAKHLESHNVEAERILQWMNANTSRIRDFNYKIEKVHAQFWLAWQKLKNMGCDVVDVYGASTKGNTLVQWLGLRRELIRWAIERSSAKFGRLTVNGIPIVGEEQGRQQPADAWVVLPWHFRAGILKRERQYLKNGGRVLFPQPEPEIVESGTVVKGEDGER